jgi:DNA repair protein RecO (recombination protein O)
VPAEKTDAIVIRLADFSESSKVVTMFTRDFGKVAALAGAKRLKSPFEAALDLLTESRVVFLRKSSAGLDLLTEAQLISRFRPSGADLTRLYSGYYVAELLDGSIQEYDPHPNCTPSHPTRLQPVGRGRPPTPSCISNWKAPRDGHLPTSKRSPCHEPIAPGAGARSGLRGLICAVRRPQYEHTEVHGGRRPATLVAGDQWRRIAVSQQFKELRRIVTAISHVRNASRGCYIWRFSSQSQPSGVGNQPEFGDVFSDERMK